jgi:hypothetical protein
MNDYKAFVSYHPCHKRTITLGDESTLAVMGMGIAKFYFDGKVLLICVALHIPGL